MQLVLVPLETGDITSTHTVALDPNLSYCSRNSSGASLSSITASARAPSGTPYPHSALGTRDDVMGLSSAAPSIALESHLNQSYMSTGESAGGLTKRSATRWINVKKSSVTDEANSLADGSTAHAAVDVIAKTLIGKSCPAVTTAHAVFSRPRKGRSSRNNPAKPTIITYETLLPLFRLKLPDACKHLVSTCARG
jgi:hypothetical protein